MVGQLGCGNGIHPIQPANISAGIGSPVVQISSGFHHNACITSDGHLYTWGLGKQ